MELQYYRKHQHNNGNSLFVPIFLIFKATEKVTKFILLYLRKYYFKLYSKNSVLKEI
jgi:hypothetical protein